MMHIVVQSPLWFKLLVSLQLAPFLHQTFVADSQAKLSAFAGFRIWGGRAMVSIRPAFGCIDQRVVRRSHVLKLRSFASCIDTAAPASSRTIALSNQHLQHILIHWCFSKRQRTHELARFLRNLFEGNLLWWPAPKPVFFLARLRSMRAVGETY